MATMNRLSEKSSKRDAILIPHPEGLPPPLPPYYHEHHESTSSSPTERSYSEASSSNSRSTSLSQTDSFSAQPRPMRTVSANRLQKIIAIPATDAKLGSPFLRAYPPCLEEFAIPKEVFLRFMDDLNRVAVANPPLQVLGMVANVVSFVPLVLPTIIGTAVAVLAFAGTYALSKGRTEMFLKRANKDVFRPRGLKVEIAKVDALAVVAGIPIINRKAHVEKDTAILGPIADMEEHMDMAGQERRLRALEPWIAHLDLSDLPEVNVPDNMMSKWSASSSERQRRRGEKRMLRHRRKAVEGYYKSHAKADFGLDKQMASLEEQLEKTHLKQMELEEADVENPEKLEKQLAKMEKQLAKLEAKREKTEVDYETKKTKIETSRMKKDKEEKKMRKILWVIIRNVEADSGEGEDPYGDDADVDGTIDFEGGENLDVHAEPKAQNVLEAEQTHEAEEGYLSAVSHQDSYLEHWQAPWEGHGPEHETGHELEHEPEIEPTTHHSWL